MTRNQKIAAGLVLVLIAAAAAYYFLQSRGNTSALAIAGASPTDARRVDSGLATTPPGTRKSGGGEPNA